jgi:predicted CXXCH cytochrome family protein
MGLKVKYMYIVVLISLISVISACSHKTLSFFFDGVPYPDDSLAVSSNNASYQADTARINEILAMKAGPELTYHMPYLDKECAACHDEKVMGKFVAPQPELCYQCHVDFSTTYAFLHAPVEMGECTSCHSPHMAKEAGLLLRTGQQLCLECHDEGDILKQENHDGIGDAACTECHNPHGGSESKLLN